MRLSVEPAVGGWSRDNEELNRAPEVVVFEVTDTGIGIPSDKQYIIFEAFTKLDILKFENYDAEASDRELGLA